MTSTGAGLSNIEDIKPNFVPIFTEPELHALYTAKCKDSDVKFRDAPF